MYHGLWGNTGIIGLVPYKKKVMKNASCFVFVTLWTPVLQSHINFNGKGGVDKKILKKY